MSKKVLFVALAALGLSSAALASANSTSTAPDVYVGVQAGYGDTNWDDFAVSQNIDGLGSFGSSASDTGFAGRAFAGYDFNQYLAVEGGYTYFPNSDISLKGTNDKINIKTYGLDLVGRINVPVTDGFGLYAKAGPGYLHSALSATGDDISGSTKTSNVDLVYGFGADYQINQHFVADVSFTRFNGDHSLNDLSKLAEGKSGGYQPNADLYAVGLAYKFNV